MPHIIERERKDGSTAYLAQIDIKRNGRRLHREARIFDRKAAANAWIKKRTKKLEALGDDLSKAKTSKTTLGDAIERYTRDSLKEIGRTKAQVLRTILDYDVASMKCEDIKSQDIAAVFKRLDKGARAVAMPPCCDHFGLPVFLCYTGPILLGLFVERKLLAAFLAVGIPLVAIGQGEAVIPCEFTGHIHQLLFVERYLHGFANVRVDARPDHVTVFTPVFLM